MQNMTTYNWEKRRKIILLRGLLIIAVGALLVANTIVESDRADRYLHLSRNATSPEEADAYYSDYSRHLDARDRMVWWTVGFWLVNMLDAYIDGHLFAFSRQ